MSMTRMGISTSVSSRPVCRRMERKLPTIKKGPMTTLILSTPPLRTKVNTPTKPQGLDPFNTRSDALNGQQPAHADGDDHDRQENRPFGRCFGNVVRHGSPSKIVFFRQSRPSFMYHVI